MRLNIGCGSDIRLGWVNMDILPLDGVAIKHDANITPYPFKNNSFDEIEAKHLIEHIPDTISFINELYRIAKPHAVIRIITPYWNHQNAWADPTHVKAFTEDTLINLSHPASDRFGFKSLLWLKSVKLRSGPYLSLIPYELRHFLAKFLNSMFYEMEAEYVVVK